MLQQISDALKTVGKPVFYGMAGTLDGDDIWDYIVFFRATAVPSANKTGLTDTYTVAIVQEEYVDDGTAYGVVDAMTSLPGVRLAASGGTYEYSRKPSTGQVIEILALDFVSPKKRCADGS